MHLKESAGSQQEVGLYFKLSHLWEICLVSCSLSHFPLVRRVDFHWVQILYYPFSYPAKQKMEYSWSPSVDMTSGTRLWVWSNTVGGHAGRVRSSSSPPPLRSGLKLLTLEQDSERRTSCMTPLASSCTSR